MKIIGRILILLLAAALVIGVTYAFSQTAAARTMASTRGGHGGFENHEFRGDPSQMPGNFGGRGAGQDGFERGPRGGGFEREFGGLAWTIVLRNLGIMAGVIVAVQVLRIGWRKLRPTNGGVGISA